jgi:hypothetical protein
MAYEQHGSNLILCIDCCIVLKNLKLLPPAHKNRPFQYVWKYNWRNHFFPKNDDTISYKKLEDVDILRHSIGYFRTVVAPTIEEMEKFTILETGYWKHYEASIISI